MPIGRPPITDGLDKSKLHFVNIDGIRTRYYEDGSGETLLLLCGGSIGSQYSLDGWSLNLSGLAKDFHVYALDRLGQGFTDPPARETDYTFEAGYGHAIAFMKALGMSRVNLVGHSSGAVLAAWIALEHPDLLKKLVLVDSATLSPENPVFPVMDLVQKWNEDVPTWFYGFLSGFHGPFTRETIRLEPDAQAFYKEQVTDNYVERLWEFARRPEHQAARERMLRLGKTLDNPNRRRIKIKALRRLEEDGLKVPTLVVWGLNDRGAPFPLGLRLFEVISLQTPRAELHVINGAGHNCYRDQPEAFNRILKSFCLG
ncbi:MAG: alpha/beta hydrolase [Chloroflexi bacterium]|nr:alpha/beta hydrolase [Chloroflexota bacterium]